MTSAKLRVASGAPDQLRGGETSSPSHVNSFGMAWPPLNALLVSVNAIGTPARTICAKPRPRVVETRCRPSQGMAVWLLPAVAMAFIIPDPNVASDAFGKYSHR